MIHAQVHKFIAHKGYYSAGEAQVNDLAEARPAFLADWTIPENLAECFLFDKSQFASLVSRMEPQNLHKETSDQGGLRLVGDAKGLMESPPLEKQFVNFMFFRLHPEWRKLTPETKSVFKAEFRSVFDEFRSDFLLFTYSLVGFDSKADIMFWRIGTSLDLIQEMTAKLYRTNMGSFFEVADNYLSVTKRMMFTADGTEDRSHVRAGEKKYHFVYPCAKHMDWYEKTGDERDLLIEENFMVGKRFQNIRIHMTHAFGFSEQEYLISFETDEPNDFLALAEELRQTPASKLTLRGMPIYTCRQRSLMECLDALG
jgi:chlorite dismutase